jgi:hypothetical protein
MGMMERFVGAILEAACPIEIENSLVSARETGAWCMVDLLKPDRVMTSALCDTRSLALGGPVR